MCLPNKNEKEIKQENDSIRRKYINKKISFKIKKNEEIKFKKIDTNDKNFEDNETSKNTMIKISVNKIENNNRGKQSNAINIKDLNNKTYVYKRK